MPRNDVSDSGEFSIGADLTVHRLGFGAMRITGTGIWGEPDVTGKPAANDLRQHKKTLPVVHALATPGAGAAELTKLLSDGELSADGLGRALEILEASGGRAWSLQVAEQHLARALDALEGAELATGPAGELRDIASFVVGRDF